MAWWWYVAVLLVVIIGAIYATLIALEDYFLLHPTVCDTYLAFDDSMVDYFHLRSGALLLHCRCSQPDTVKRRPIMCLHGNAGNLDGMANLARTLGERGYSVYLLEPAGYGVCSRRHAGDQKKIAPTTDSLVRDLHEAWAALSKQDRSECILTGFSMGGGVICQFLTTVDVEDFPAQIVLINTFYDLPTLISQVFPFPVVSTLMHTKWNATKGLERYCANRLATVTIVATLDDELIPMDHSKKLMESIRDTHTRRELIILPNGGHNNAAEPHFALWLPSLLPPIPTPTPTNLPTDLPTNLK
jgi:esterase/lipase